MKLLWHKKIFQAKLSSNKSSIPRDNNDLRFMSVRRLILEPLREAKGLCLIRSKHKKYLNQQPINQPIRNLKTLGNFLTRCVMEKLPD